MQVGDNVKVKPPFSDLSTTYTVTEISEPSDGVLVYFLDGFDGGFSEIYLEEV